MPTRIDLDLYQGNDETVNLTISNADTGAVQNLTGATISVYFKDSYRTADGSATVLSTGTGEVVIVSAAAGTARIDVPASALATAGRRWWRADVTLSGDTRTACYGTLMVVDL